MFTDKSHERYSQMGVLVDSSVILRQCCPRLGAPRVRLAAAKLLQFDRLWRSITQAVKK